MAIELEGHVAIVTGAARGLGRCHARALAKRGARIVANDLALDGEGPSTALSALVEEIRRSGGDAVAAPADVGTVRGVTSAIEVALDAYGSVDILINNAGTIRDRSVGRLTEEEWDTVQAVNLKGPFLLSQAAFRHMKERGYGRLVHTTSGAGLFGNFGQSNYSAAKMGLVGLSRTLALEGARAGITSNVIAPVASTNDVTADLLGPLAGLLPPEQAAALVVLLSSDDCPVSGEVFSIIGGRYAKVFTAVTPGWFAGVGAVPEPETLLEHFSAICAEDGYLAPTEAREEFAAVAPLLQGGSN